MTQNTPTPTSPAAGRFAIETRAAVLGVAGVDYCLVDTHTDNHDIIARIEFTGDEETDSIRTQQAALLEAAPELREALQYARERLQEIDQFTAGQWSSGSTLEIIDTAIAKAEGR